MTQRLLLLGVDFYNDPIKLSSAMSSSLHWCDFGKGERMAELSWIYDCMAWSCFKSSPLSKLKNISNDNIRAGN
jgi:hypothetical protein